MCLWGFQERHTVKMALVLSINGLTKLGARRRETSPLFVLSIPQGRKKKLTQAELDWNYSTAFQDRGILWITGRLSPKGNI